MNKGELIERISKDAKLSKAKATAALNATLSSVHTALKKGGKVTLVGFGTFSVAKRKARTGRNPQTGAKLKIAARRIAKFAPGVGLKKAVNRGR
jgi:DNA-binding protein HU-beta